MLRMRADIRPVMPAAQAFDILGRRDFDDALLSRRALMQARLRGNEEEAQLLS